MKEVSFESRGLKIAGWMIGEGIPVISTHGWLDNANTWRPVAERMEGVCWVSLDMPGHGLSGHVRDGETYHFVDYVPVILDVAEQLGWEQFHLVGHSMGGSVVMLTAATFPEKVLSVTVMDSYGPRISDETIVETLRLSILSRQRRKGLKHRPSPTREALVDKMRAGNATVTEEAVQLLADRMIEQRDGAWYFTYDFGVRDLSPMRFREPHLAEIVDGIKAPALLMRASQGGILHYGPRNELFARCSTMKVIDVDGNHHVHLNDPDQIAPLIQEFLTTVAASSTSPV